MHCCCRGPCKTPAELLEQATIISGQILKVRGTAYEAPDLPVVVEVSIPVEYLAP